MQLTSESAGRPEATIVCIASNARSGSTALRKALAAGAGMKDFGEIFHDDRNLTALPFLDFLERWRNPLLAVIDWPECVEISRAYIRQLSFASGDLQPLIDIKHNAWNISRPLWQFPHDEPLFMTALKQNRALFIQLKRDNLADQVISYIIAMQSGIWHRRITPRDLPETLLGKPFDAKLVRHLCELFVRAESLTEELLLNYPHHLTLLYEQVFANGVLTPEAADMLAAKIGRDVCCVTLPLLPNAISKPEAVTNYPEICEIAAAVKFASAARAKSG